MLIKIYNPAEKIWRIDIEYVEYIKYIELCVINFNIRENEHVYRKYYYNYYHESLNIIKHLIVNSKCVNVIYFY